MHGHQEYGKETLQDDRQCCINASANHLIHTKLQFFKYLTTMKIQERKYLPALFQTLQWIKSQDNFAQDHCSNISTRRP